MIKVINFALYQLGWFACVLLGATGFHWLGPLAVVAIIAYHLRTVHSPGAESRLLFRALLIGLMWENFLTLSGLLVYPTGQPLGILAPIWILAMWPLLAITLNVSLRWLKGKPWLAALFGGIGGPLAFLAGERLGAVMFPDMYLAMAVLALGWACLFPLMTKLAERHDGYPSGLRQPAEVMS
jgi:hypothetical protein